MSVICISSKASTFALAATEAATGLTVSSIPSARALCIALWISCMNAWKCTRRAGTDNDCTNISINMDFPRPTPPHKYSPLGGSGALRNQPFFPGSANAALIRSSSCTAASCAGSDCKSPQAQRASYVSVRLFIRSEYSEPAAPSTSDLLSFVLKYHGGDAKGDGGRAPLTHGLTRFQKRLLSRCANKDYLHAKANAFNIAGTYRRLCHHSGRLCGPRQFRRVPDPDR